MIDDVVDVDHVGVVDSAGGQGFAAEHVRRGRAAGGCSENSLDGHALAGALVGCLPHRGHATPADQSIDAVVAAHDLPGLQTRIFGSLGLLLAGHRGRFTRWIAWREMQFPSVVVTTPC